MTDVRAAVASGAPQLWPEAPGNIGFDWSAPADPDGKNQAALERAFKDAAHVVRVELVNQRLVVASLEPRTATASYDAGSKQFTLRCGTQGVAAVRGQIAGAMGIKPEELRILTDDLGGAFGMKGWCYPEYVPMLHAARALGKPIHWVSTRAEAFVSDNQGRDSFWSAELALNKRGRFLGLRVDCLGNVGAYITGVAHFVFTTHISGCLPTVYDIPHAQVNTRCVLTNTLPTGPYRGAGRPEASYLMERLIDAAADATGIDAAELRRRNLIAPDKIPYTTAFGNTYDSGDFPGGLRARAGARRLRRLCRAQEGGKKDRQTARHRHRLLSGDRRRVSGRSRAHYVSRRQGSQCQHRRRRQRAGASDRVRQRGGAPARHRARGGDGDVGRLARATCPASARSPRARRCMSAARLRSPPTK